MSDIYILIVWITDLAMVVYCFCFFRSLYLVKARKVKNGEKNKSLTIARHTTMILLIVSNCVYLVANIHTSTTMYFLVISTLFISATTTITQAKTNDFKWVILELVEVFSLIILFYANLYEQHIDLLCVKNLSPVALIYYSIATFTTVGYGDIHPILLGNC